MNRTEPVTRRTHRRHEPGLDVVEPGPLATIQDLGRPGLAEIGVGTSGAADRGSLRLANRLVGNDEGAAAVEVTLGGLVVRAREALTVAVTGAPCPITVNGRGAAPNTVLRLPAGAQLCLGRPDRGLRSYLAVRGGIAVEPVLGSRSTDVLAGLGPDPLTSGTLLPVGPAPAEFPTVETAPVAPPGAGEISLAVVTGPRDDWFTEQALATLLGEPYEVTPDSNRIGMRLSGPVPARRTDTELPSEGMVAGSVQVPPSGRPTLFLADHPSTGGYPVIAVVVSSDVDAAAQARPGQRIRFHRTDPDRPRSARRRRLPH
ncbi:biotin-dependent carboxylase-like uncharacterized protein [Halopolyspora algeriensis]|uniref:Biotin-dependent carboxylase-like uncharacterized protein n=1 Tax=Halopolyspora algeriensis TaxID=1500506 RepID=A0A368VY12_9ACTN|nr:biotin-dependent carboxyltransferase family protein [Halopolyspora algeriensis]RCW45732.1 biotin-dependent carboxylase-like uncharacterized protein [Halopolyspora algeriensis]TQM54116.1 biotin-dependent carboxylase-like uncharacterized protein [Halopolyspora algeriensis]